MKICTEHWERIIGAIKSKGLMDFISFTAEEAAEKLKSQMESKQVTKDNFEPVTFINSMITMNAFKVAGPVAFENNEDGTERCPICFLKAEAWITKVADSVVEMSQRVNKKARKVEDLPPELRRQILQMMSIDGLYVCVDTLRKEFVTAIVSKEGKLYSMRLDEELSPGGFFDTCVFEGPILVGKFSELLNIFKEGRALLERWMNSETPLEETKTFMKEANEWKVL